VHGGGQVGRFGGPEFEVLGEGDECPEGGV